MERLCFVILSILLILSSCASLGVRSGNEFKIEKFAVCDIEPEGRYDYQETFELYAGQTFYLFFSYNKLTTKRVEKKDCLYLTYMLTLIYKETIIWYDLQEFQGEVRDDLSEDHFWYVRVLGVSHSAQPGAYRMELMLVDVYGEESAMEVVEFVINEAVQGSII